MSETSEWTGGATTLPPRHLEWIPPSAPGGGGGGAPPPWGLEGPPAVPPTHGPAGGKFRTVIAGILVLAMAVLLAGRLHSSSTSTDVSLFTPAAPTATGGGGLSSSEVSSIAAKVNKGVVDIDTTLGYEKAEAAGTGMVLTSSGVVITNNHVVLGATKITATVVDTGRTYTAHVIGTDPTDDVAIIQLEGASGLKTISPAKSSTVAVRDPVVASGNAGGKGGAPSVSAGNVVAIGQTITASDQDGSNAQRLTDLIQFDATIAPGDSGGPLANRNGEVIGMNSAAEVGGTRFSSTSSSGYAIPIAKALSIAGQIESGQASSTVHIGLPGFLGVQIAPSAIGSGRPGARNGTASSVAGAVVAGVESGAPAASIGLKAGDTIISVNGQTVDLPSTLTKLLAAQHPGDQVTVGWTDSSGARHTASATLIAGPAD